MDRLTMELLLLDDEPEEPSPVKRPPTRRYDGLTTSEIVAVLSDLRLEMSRRRRFRKPGTR